MFFMPGTKMLFGDARETCEGEPAVRSLNHSCAGFPAGRAHGKPGGLRWNMSDSYSFRAAIKKGLEARLASS